MKNKELLKDALNYLDHPAKGLSASVDIAIDNLKNDIRKKLRGGSRKGSGRKKGPETKTISFRVKLDQIEIVRDAVRKALTRP